MGSRVMATGGSRGVWGWGWCWAGLPLRAVTSSTAAGCGRHVVPRFPQLVARARGPHVLCRRGRWVFAGLQLSQLSPPAIRAGPTCFQSKALLCPCLEGMEPPNPYLPALPLASRGLPSPSCLFVCLFTREAERGRDENPSGLQCFEQVGLGRLEHGASTQHLLPALGFWAGPRVLGLPGEGAYSASISCR